MRAFVSKQQAQLVHAKINVSEQDTRAVVQRFEVGAVPSYVLVEPATGEILYRQLGGSPEGAKIKAAMQRWRQASPQSDDVGS